MYDFGMKLREIRKRKNMTQKKLGEKLNLTESTVSKYEVNMSFPTFDTLRSMSAVLGVSLDELCGTEGHETTSLYNLTKEQKDIIQELINLFRNYNDGVRNRFSYEEYEVVKKIMAQLSNK